MQFKQEKVPNPKACTEKTTGGQLGVLKSLYKGQTRKKTKYKNLKDQWNKMFRTIQLLEWF